MRIILVAELMSKLYEFCNGFSWRSRAEENFYLRDCFPPRKKHEEKANEGFREGGKRRFHVKRIVPVPSPAVAASCVTEEEGTTA
jgi:hypothetical protein